MKLLAITIVTLVLSGCATMSGSMPGDLTTSESKVEGSSEVSVIPGWLAGSDMKLGIYRNTSMESGTAILVVQTKGLTASSREGLTVNIDGEKTTFSAID